MQYYDIVMLIMEHLIPKEGLNFPHSQAEWFSNGFFFNLAFKPEYINDTTNESHFQKITEEDWNNVAWNPPLYQDPGDFLRQSHPQLYEPDPDASPKPTWAEMVAGYEKYIKPERFREARETCYVKIDEVCEQLIREKYGAENNIEEIRIRLRGHWTEQNRQGDKWREHYRARHREFKVWIDTIATLEELNSTHLDLSERALWDNATWQLPLRETGDYTSGTPDENVPEAHPDPPVKE